MDTVIAIKRLEDLGLSTHAASVFIDLSTHGISTALDISKRTSVPRTSVYRAIEELESCNLVRFDGHDRTKYRANEYHLLEDLVSQQEDRLAKISDSLPELFGFFLNMSNTNNSSTTVRYFEGQEGLDKAMRRTLDTKGIYRIYELGSLSDVVEQDFAEYIRSEMVRRKQTSHQITNQKKHGNITNVEGFVNKHWFMRYVDRRLLPIDVEIAIYNDVVAIYNYDDEPFCVEITNERLARTQRGLFDYVWKTAKKMTFINNKGAAELR